MLKAIDAKRKQRLAISVKNENFIESIEDANDMIINLRQQLRDQDKIYNNKLKLQKEKCENLRENYINNLKQQVNRLKQSNDELLSKVIKTESLTLLTTKLANIFERTINADEKLKGYKLGLFVFFFVYDLFI